MDNREYITQLNAVSSLDRLREYAEENAVPIMDKVALEMVKQLMRIHKAESVLEIGTAIAYSGMHFASVDNQMHVTTIERNPEMYDLAVQNVKHFNYEKQVRLIFADAAEAFQK